MLYPKGPKRLSAKKLNYVRISINLIVVHYILANPKAKITINNNSQFTSLNKSGSNEKYPFHLLVGPYKYSLLRMLINVFDFML